MSKVKVNPFAEGQSVTLEEMLEVRENRVSTQRELLSSQKEDSLLMAIMNIPGPVKNNLHLEKAFNAVLERIEEVLSNHLPQASLYRNLKTGAEYYFLSPLTPKELKQKMVMIEETHPYGRLFDLDVLWLEGDSLKSISRTELGLPTRRCFICNRDAKDCGRSRRHSIIEMQDTISKIINEGSDQLHD
ncbi:apo-citrate lyase phosphoribosyl-dephospho-coa transferase [Trichococcus palustris]|jgi:holo-ACP synthase|uniref:citrate lyase holo-[acyl-carrier protein] synthase n=1 Tax=Trichococcus palustris TaxID=140314 RepID=A0A143YNG0_9LACT|nr:citrate lyase holo-[acyl-carrier protein] synthase [Trichococcus palustris]CZQ92641.1 apo-citrate lyase phosphoribosyl-dephospho-coa transferase [Trichococcus palustris]SFL05758.1 holo-ACP synthase [Trichococcus palustris]